MTDRIILCSALTIYKLQNNPVIILVTMQLRNWQTA